VSRLTNSSERCSPGIRAVQHLVLEGKQSSDQTWKSGPVMGAVQSSKQDPGFLRLHMRTKLGVPKIEWDLIKTHVAILAQNLSLPIGWKSYNLSNLQYPVIPMECKDINVLGITLLEK